MTDQKASILFSEYDRRHASNPKYSKRAFARDLGVSHTFLSLLEKGKRRLTPALCKDLLPKLKLNKRESQLFCIGLEKEDRYKREKISLLKFAMISDWPYYAVLSLLDTQDFQWDAEWIAKRLGITTNKAATIMRGLKSLDMIEVIDGKYKQKIGPIVVENKSANDASTSFNKRLIQKGIESMQSRDFRERDVSNMVFAMDPAFMDYAIERIRNFRRSLSRELETLGDPKEVYALAVQLFPLTQNIEKNKEKK